MKTKIYEVKVGWNDTHLGVYQGKLDEIALFLGGRYPGEALKINEIRPSAPGEATCKTVKVELYNSYFLSTDDLKSENYITDIHNVPGGCDITYTVNCENHKKRIQLNNILENLSEEDRKFIESQLS